MKIIDIFINDSVREMFNRDSVDVWLTTNRGDAMESLGNGRLFPSILVDTIDPIPFGGWVDESFLSIELSAIPNYFSPEDEAQLLLSGIKINEIYMKTSTYLLNNKELPKEITK